MELLDVKCVIYGNNGFNGNNGQNIKKVWDTNLTVRLKLLIISAVFCCLLLKCGRIIFL